MRALRFSTIGLFALPWPGVGATTHIVGTSRVGVGGIGGREGPRNVAELGVVDDKREVPEETDAERVEREESDLNMVVDLCRYTGMRVCTATLDSVNFSIVNKSKRTKS